MMNSRPKNVLWTSGWDSTFRVASLLIEQGNTVQPYYVQHGGRRSTKTELKTMDAIRDALEAKDPTIRERFLPTVTIPIEDIPENPDITRRYKALFQRSFLGSQYDWLSRLAHWKGISLELSIHRDDKAHDFLKETVEKMEDGSYKFRDGEDKDLAIFAPFVFPLFDLSKLDMQGRAEKGGFSDIMEMTWFCFNPLLDGTPCGRCNPCRYAKEEGLGRRVPPPSFFRTVQAGILRGGWGIRNQALRVFEILRGSRIP